MLKSSQDCLIACIHSQELQRVELLNYTKANGEELVNLAVELAEDPSGGVQVRVLMDANVVSGVTVVPLQQAGLRLITAPVACSAPTRFSASLSRLRSRCAEASAAGSSALVAVVATS